jgi:hypothetical protein
MTFSLKMNTSVAHTAYTQSSNNRSNAIILPAHFTIFFFFFSPTLLRLPAPLFLLVVVRVQIEVLLILVLVLLLGLWCCFTSHAIVIVVESLRVRSAHQKVVFIDIAAF